jgi:hypothetical protein
LDPASQLIVCSAWRRCGYAKAHRYFIGPKAVIHGAFAAFDGTAIHRAAVIHRD